MYFYPWLCCWCGNLQNNHKGLNPQNGNSPLLFQLKKFHRTAIKDNSECWESYTDITVNLNSLPPFHAYVDNRDCNRHVHDFLTSNRIAESAGFEYQGFRMFRFNPDRLKELAPEQFKTISAKLPPQDDMIKDIIYQERRFPLRTVQDIHGIYLVSSKELEESLIEGVRNLDAAANELLDGICLFCSTQELRYLTDAELIETIYAQ